jgi:beta-mannanase
MAINGVIVIGFAVWVLKPSAADPDTSQAETASATSTSVLQKKHAERPAPTKDQILGIQGIRFGLSAPQAPWSSDEINKISKAAGAHPTMVQFFVKWTEDFRPESVPQTYKQGALPVISWEPWAGVKAGANQPDYALAKIISGKFDPYITKFATAVRDQKWPIAIRFAHEMNGNWYPWSERTSGNHAGEYVQAWRHVHDVFQQVGATNVIWIWSPNIVRPVPNINLERLYPGDTYVDWVGMVGYAVEESTASAVFQSTMTVVRRFTQKPLVITETGVQSGPRRLTWIADFFRWLPQHPDVVGFVWFEFSKEEGGTSDWRFSAKPDTAKAVHDGLASVKLASPPPH